MDKQRESDKIEDKIVSTKQEQQEQKLTPEQRIKELENQLIQAQLLLDSYNLTDADIKRMTYLSYLNILAMSPKIDQIFLAATAEDSEHKETA